MFYEKLGKREVSILHDYLKLWTRSIEELLLKLRDTLPGDGMIGEVHYWRDMARVLEAITDELRQPFVEVVVQILQAAVDAEKDKGLESDLSKFLNEKSRAVKGIKEAKWNNKYMKIIENPVKTIEQAKELKDIVMNISALMKSLHSIYKTSNFYKESRIVSFVDRLLECMQ